MLRDIPVVVLLVFARPRALQYVLAGRGASGAAIVTSDPGAATFAVDHLPRGIMRR